MNIKKSTQQEMIDYATGKSVSTKKIMTEDLTLPYEHSTRTAAFALRILDEKRDGTFIEVGASHWRDGNQTYMLEKEFNWKGVGIEIQDHFVKDYKENRISDCIAGNALTFNWDEYLEKNNFPKRIDFLQVDVDDIIPHSNLLALINIPLGRYRFSTISIEHLGHFDKNYEKDRDAQRQVLYSYGYTLVASLFTEDWWIDSQLNISPNTYDQLTSDSWLRRLY